MREIIDNPPPLNLYTSFPFVVRPFPFDWLNEALELSAFSPAPTDYPLSAAKTAVE